jgi:hypothetical protein
LYPPTTRVPRLTRDSEGKPFRRLLVTSKAVGVEVLFLESHGTPPCRSAGDPRGASYGTEVPVAKVR